MLYAGEIIMKTICRRITVNIHQYLFLALSLLIIGCNASVPHQVFHETSMQKKMQAAKHWDILATDVAEQISMTIPKHKELQVAAFFVKSSDDTPFGKLFDRILISHLIKNGLVITNKDEHAVIIEYTAKVIGHAERMNESVPIKYTALGLGVNVARGVYLSAVEGLIPLAIPLGALLDVGSSNYTGKLASNEVIICTSLTYKNRIYFQQADIYYINDPEWWHYDDKPYFEEKKMEGQQRFEGKKYEVTDKK